MIALVSRRLLSLPALSQPKCRSTRKLTAGRRIRFRK